MPIALKTMVNGSPLGSAMIRWALLSETLGRGEIAGSMLTLAGLAVVLGAPSVSRPEALAEVG